MQDVQGGGGGAQQVLMYGIGAQKAGTSWLQSALEGRDGVFLQKPKELHYWDCIRAPYLRDFKLRAQERLRVPGPGAPLRHRLSRFWRADLRQRIALAERYAAIYRSAPHDHAPYLSYLGAGRSDARLVGDITPSYALLSRDVFAEMLASAPDVRFVFIMRDPVARLWSGVQQHYKPERAQGLVTDQDLDRRFEAICAVPADPNFLRSDYPGTMAELEAAVPSERIHYAFFETLVDPDRGEVERGRLAEFLGVPASWLNPRNKVHSTRNAHRISPESRAMARQSMAGIYAALHGRFGDRLPEAWLP